MKWHAMPSSLKDHQLSPTASSLRDSYECLLPVVEYQASSLRDSYECLLPVVEYQASSHPSSHEVLCSTWSTILKMWDPMNDNYNRTMASSTFQGWVIILFWNFHTKNMEWSRIFYKYFFFLRIFIILKISKFLKIIIISVKSPMYHSTLLSIVHCFSISPLKEEKPCT